MKKLVGIEEVELVDVDGSPTGAKVSVSLSLF